MAGTDGAPRLNARSARGSESSPVATSYESPSIVILCTPTVQIHQAGEYVSQPGRMFWNYAQARLLGERPWKSCAAKFSTQSRRGSDPRRLSKAERTNIPPPFPPLRS